MNEFLNVKNIVKKQGQSLALNDISFRQHQFQKIAVAGETGSGKTTLLKIIAGLVQPDSGTIEFEGKRLLGPEEKLMPGHPSIAYVSQHFEMPNHYRVEELVNFENKLTLEAASRIYNICRIDHLLLRKTDQLSGGEKQRIGLARRLITSPDLLLLDEPFSNLDMIHRSIMHEVVHEISEQLKITCILVAHDPADTLSWADEMIILRNGSMVQQGHPLHLYHHPADRYSGALLGHYNILPGFFSTYWQLPDAAPDESLFIRPEKLELTSKGQGLEAIVEKILFMGAQVMIRVHAHKETFHLYAGDHQVVAGDTVYIRHKGKAVWHIRN